MKLSVKDKAFLKVTSGLVNKKMSDQEAISVLVNGGFSEDSESAKMTISLIKNDIAQMQIDTATGVK